MLSQDSTGTAAATLLLVPSSLFSALVACAIVWPFQSLLVRLRANYRPRTDGRLALGEDGEREGAAAGPDVKGLADTARRVIWFEGWGGLYRGVVPSALGTVFETAVFVLCGLNYADGAAPSVVGQPLLSLLQLTVIIVKIPLEVLANR